MRIEVTAKHVELTDAIRQYADTKCARLPRFYDGVQSIQVLIVRPQKREEFEIEIRADVEKHDDFVAKERGHDIYGCIDLCVDKLARQLADFKERLKNSKRA